MHPISSAQKENILSLASHGHSTCSIAKKTGLGKSTVIRTLHNLLPNHQMPSSGCPSQLSSRAQHAILSQITMGKASNAVQATKHIPSFPIQSAHRQLEMFSRNIHSRLSQRRKSHCSVQCIGRRAWPLP